MWCHSSIKALIVSILSGAYVVQVTIYSNLVFNGNARLVCYSCLVKVHGRLESQVLLVQMNNVVWFLTKSACLETVSGFNSFLQYVQKNKISTHLLRPLFIG